MKLAVIIRRVEEAEVDEMWSFVGNKAVQRWLWHATNHQSSTVLAYVVGPRKDAVYVKWKALWSHLASRVILTPTSTIRASGTRSRSGEASNITDPD